MTDLDDPDRAVVNAFQGGFPVVERPFEPAAAALRERGVEVSGSDLLRRIRRLDESGVLSRFGALVDADAIGGATTLVAASVPRNRFETVVERINAHEEVAHNYERDHDLNVWFVLSVADPDRIEPVLDAIEAETGVETYAFPKREEFHLRATFPVEGPLGDCGDDVDLSHLGPDPGSVPDDETGGLTPGERDLVAAVHDGFPLSPTPYADVADEVGRDVQWVLSALNRLRAAGKVRRVGVVPNHYAIGYTENAMTVWDVPDDDVRAVGEAVGELPFVTHCYERPRYDGVWRFNLFAMVHGRTPAELDARERTVRECVADRTALRDDDWDRLVSTRILKKTGINLVRRASSNATGDVERRETGESP